MAKMAKTSAQLEREIARALSTWQTSRPPGRQKRGKRSGAHHIRRNYMDTRKGLDAAAARVGPDTTIDPMEQALIAADVIDDYPRYETIIAGIPPVVLGKTKHRVVSGGRHGLDLVGPRGGSSSLVRSTKDPSAWAHNTSSGYSVKTVWYRRNPDFTFTRI